LRRCFELPPTCQTSPSTPNKAEQENILGASRGAPEPLASGRESVERRRFGSRGKMALHRRRPPPGLIHHSDQGGQYVSVVAELAGWAGRPGRPNLQGCEIRTETSPHFERRHRYV
jgi:hypothetical protein